MRFAHISDIHLGFQKNPALQDIEQHVFEDVLDRCISMNVDFILMPGDIFHVNIPPMRVQKYAFAKFRQVYEAGIPVYVVYGSHDFSPVSGSVIDLLASIGYITKVTRAESSADGTISLDFIRDKTGAKITGLSGLKAGNDRTYYEKLNRAALESEPGFKIFLFHGGIAEMKDNMINEGEMMPLSLLPKGFAYYAGGHMHMQNVRKFDRYAHVVYPGTPFAGFHSDLENNAVGTKRGFFVVEFEDDVKSVGFVHMENASYGMIGINAEGKGAESVNAELQQRTNDIDPAGKIMIIKVSGEMSSGKTADVDVSAARASLAQRGAVATLIKKNKLKSKEYEITPSKGADRKEIEAGIFFENIGQLRLGREDLAGERGVGLAVTLLHTLGAEQLANEKKAGYTDRVKKDALAVLGMDNNDS